MSNSNNRRELPLPPPPNMKKAAPGRGQAQPKSSSSKSQSSKSQSSLSQSQSQSPVHSSLASIPTLASAPPSANFDFNLDPDSAAYSADYSTSTSTSTTSSSFALPPPPPPAHRGHANANNNANVNANNNPTMAAMPVPPSFASTQPHPHPHNPNPPPPSRPRPPPQPAYEQRATVVPVPPHVPPQHQQHQQHQQQQHQQQQQQQHQQQQQQQPTIVPLPPPPAMMKVPPPASSNRPDVYETEFTAAAAANAGGGGDGGDGEGEGEEVQQQEPYANVAVAVPIQQPNPLPLTTFIAAANKSNHSQQQQQHQNQNQNSSNSYILAKRQTHIPVVIIATEAANLAAWKNSLLLTDLLEGLYQAVGSTAAQQQQQGTSGTSSLSSSGAITPLAPFRSVTKSLHLDWSDVQVTFSDPMVSSTAAAAAASTADADQQAANTLASHAKLMEQDGNLEYELQLLQDQVDNLLQDHTSGSAGGSNSSSNNSNTNDPMNWYQDRQKELEQVTKDAFALTSPLDIPWLLRYRLALDASTGGGGGGGSQQQQQQQQHDLMHSPAIILTVCTTREVTSPVETLKALQSPHYLPTAFQNGLLDMRSVRYEALVLHDNSEGLNDHANDPSDNTNNTTNTNTNPDGTTGVWDDRPLRQQLEQTFGPTAALVRCNSIPTETAVLLSREETNDLWGGGGQLGNCLSMSDRVVLRKYLAALVTNSILPAMERRITNLNVIVNDRKKGVKNVFKSLWRTGKTKQEESNDGSSGHHGGGGTGGTGFGGTGGFGALVGVGTGAGAGGGAQSSGSGGANEIKYRYDSVESQTRLLADSLFLMKDYEAALSMYRLIKDDFKQDKAMAHYGSTQEMMALCMYLTDPYGKARDIFAHMEGALLSYNRAADEERASAWGDKSLGRPTAAPPSTRLATRLCLILTSTRNICTGRYLEVADLLASASSSETALGAAVLLEQSSAHYFKAEMYRKYAFHMLMSGHMFRSAEQEHHAFRCFTSALYIYRDGKWDELHNHLRSALAAQLYSMGKMAVSLQLYAKLVGCTDGGRVSVKSQQKFMAHLLEICNEHTKKALVGADRMAAPGHLTGAERDAVRKDRLERIVQVVRYTRSASRVLELPNMNLPCIEDSTLNVIAEETSRMAHGNVLSFGDAGPGSDEVWDELMLTTIAELRTVDTAKPQIGDDMGSKVLATIEDPEIRSVIAQIDKEKANRNKAERSKRFGNSPEIPPVRAQMEPLTVEFFISNPLGIPIDLSGLQLVARMTDEKLEQVCTNEDAVKITPLRSSNEKQKWTFHSSSVEFEAADFCRISAGGDPQKQSWKTADDTAPFFVVTKNDITLDPESRRNISASICPLVQGDLEILGVRCRLFDDIWVYHPFDVKGRLLQNTRSNRANRVRAESLLLKAKVERGMPCLTADLVPTSSANSKQAGGPALQGQISEWTLRLSNVGTAAATSVTLKTNVPWVNIVGGNVSERQATSFCVGPTSTLMRLPMEGAGLEHNGQIQPGETLEVPVLMRTSGSGKQEFYMLFRYELMESPTRFSPRHRWLRKMFEVPVYPSLTLSASIVPSYEISSEHVLSVQLTNYRTDRPDKLQVILESLSVASRRYRLEPMPGQLAGIGSDMKLDWRERLSVHYRVVALEEESKTCLLTECSLSGSNENECQSKPCASSTALGFLALERAHEHFEDTWRSHQRALARAASSESQGDGHPRSIAQIRRANTSNVTDSERTDDGDVTVETIRPTSIARLCPSGDDTIHISCVWKTAGDDSNSNVIHGEHHIRGLSVRPAYRTKACPVTITAEHPVTFSNNFDNGPAMVPLQVTLRNRLTEEAVDFEFTVETPETFDYIGPESFQWVLEAGGHVTVPLQALIPTAGVYNLQHIRLTVGEDQAYLFPLQWMVTVTNRDVGTTESDAPLRNPHSWDDL